MGRERKGFLMQDEKERQEERKWQVEISETRPVNLRQEKSTKNRGGVTLTQKNPGKGYPSHYSSKGDSGTLLGNRGESTKSGGGRMKEGELCSDSSGEIRVPLCNDGGAYILGGKQGGSAQLEAKNLVSMGERKKERRGRGY